MLPLATAAIPEIGTNGIDSIRGRGFDFDNPGGNSAPRSPHDLNPHLFAGDTAGNE